MNQSIRRISLIAAAGAALLFSGKLAGQQPYEPDGNLASARTGGSNLAEAQSVGSYRALGFLGAVTASVAGRLVMEDVRPTPVALLLGSLTAIMAAGGIAKKTSKLPGEFEMRIQSDPEELKKAFRDSFAITLSTRRYRALKLGTALGLVTGIVAIAVFVPNT